MFRTYRTGELFDYLGISRDTLRFYEEKGLLQPEKDQENSYRNYSVFDVFRIMIIDYYKKRGLSIQEIQSLLRGRETGRKPVAGPKPAPLGQMDGNALAALFREKRSLLEAEIREKTAILERLAETEEFLASVPSHLGRFSIAAMPCLDVVGEMSDFIAVEEYEQVKSRISDGKGDFFAHILRVIDFDASGIRDTHMLIVHPHAGKTSPQADDSFLYHPTCLYTVEMEHQPNQEPHGLMGKLHAASLEQARARGVALTGKAYARIRHIEVAGASSTSYLEVFVPFR